MAAIYETVYPRLKTFISKKELQRIYSPTQEEIRFIRKASKSANVRLCLLIQLKTFQRLGRFERIGNIPSSIIKHISEILGFKSIPNMVYAYDRSGTKIRHIAQLRSYLQITSFSAKAKKLSTTISYEAAKTKAELADIVNIVIEELIRKRYELPSFSTILNLAKSARNRVNNEYYGIICQNLSATTIKKLDGILEKPKVNSKTDWDLIRQDTQSPTVKNIKTFILRFKWLKRFSFNKDVFLEIPEKKIKQFSDEAMSLDAGEIKKLKKVKRYSLLILAIRMQIASAFDDLGEMFIKRVKRMHRLGKQALDEYHLKHINEAHRLVKILRRIVYNHEQDDAPEPITDIIGESPSELLQKCDDFSAHADNNYYHFLPRYFKGIRQFFFKFIEFISLKSSSTDKDMEKVIKFLIQHKDSKSELLHLSSKAVGKNNKVKKIKLPTNWISEKWGGLIFLEGRTKEVEVVKRKYFEICAFSFIANELQSGDLYIPDSEKLSDYRQQLISWDEYETEKEVFEAQTGKSTNPKDFISELKEKLGTAARDADNDFPKNEYVRIENNEPVISKITKDAKPKGFNDAYKLISKNMPETNIIDILTDTEHWLNWTKVFGPLSGFESKITNAKSRYITTSFCYGCNLGPSQTSKSLPEYDRRQISFVNHRHITEEKLDDAIKKVVNSYQNFSLPKLWGSGKSASADGTKWDLYEKNLLSEYHIRYGGYGGIGYYHVSDSYIAFFSRFIPCGVWEGIYILDALIENQSDLNPDTLHADTQGQSAPIFGLAYLLGINLMPRIRNWKDLRIFKAEKNTTYNHIESLFSDQIDWALIETHLTEMIRVALSIKAGKISASTILKRLGTKSRKNKLYFAFRELGRAARSIFLLQYLNDFELRKTINSATNKSEAFNGFTKWIAFGNNATIAENNREEQRKIIKYNHLVSSLVIIHNVDSMTKILKQLKMEGKEISKEILESMSPFKTDHINRFGKYILNIANRPSPMQFSMT